MKILIISLLCFCLFRNYGFCAEVTLTWDGPIVNTDNTLIDDCDLYTLYIDKGNGTEFLRTVKSISTTCHEKGIRHVVNFFVGLEPINVIFYVTASDFAGNESAYSNPGRKLMDDQKPSTPN